MKQRKGMAVVITAAIVMSSLCAGLQTHAALNGTLMQNLHVFDSENAADWSITYELQEQYRLYGDRDFTLSGVPTNLRHAEAIRTACDSKLYAGDQASFTAAQDITVYIAVDTRVLEQQPIWLSAWDTIDMDMQTSNAVTLSLYKRDAQAGETVTLGTNGGLGLSANYIVIAVPQEHIRPGDLNADGAINALDLSMAKHSLSTQFTNTVAKQAADIDTDGTPEVDDLVQLYRYIQGGIDAFTTDTKPVTGEEYMNSLRGTIVGSEPSDATAELVGRAYGTYEKTSIYSNVCQRNKSFNVLLPAGYTTEKQYPVLYVLHGYWGNEDALLDAGDASLRLRQIIGNAIATGEAEDMIVVFPDIYASATQDACDGLNAKNNAAYDNFINLLIQEIMPYMEANYSIKTGRENTAITGFSMGGRESLYIGFSRPDLFGYVGAMCPAPGLTTDLIAADALRFDTISPYLLLVSAGSNDTLIWSTPSGYHDTLTNNGVPHIWHYVDGGDHGGKTIRPHMYYFVRSIFKAE